MAQLETHHLEAPGEALAASAQRQRGILGPGKRVLDIAISAIALTFASPILLIIAIAVRLEDGGPVFFMQRRHGVDRRIFRIMKFRTMRAMEDGAKVKQAVPGDPRITWIGAFLRKSSLDELPQLFNVLMGDMSLVGPRPHALAHDDLFGQRVTGYNSRFRCKPGMTGLAQINGERGLIQSDDDVARRLKFDLEYQQRWSLGYDLWLIIITPFVLVYHLVSKRAY